MNLWMMLPRRLPLKLLPVLLLVALQTGLNNGCHRDSGNPVSDIEQNTEPAVLTVSPIPLEKITDLEPLGWMNPVGHTIPTDHVYFYTAWTYGQPPPDSIPIIPVLAPGMGVVTWILQEYGPHEDAKFYVRINKFITYYLDHVVLDSTIKVGSKITAGQIVGISKGISIDLGMINDTLILPGFVNPARYEGQMLHTDSPYKYFAEPLRSQLYAMVRRNAPDKDGKIDYDVRGRLIGNWFHESVTIAESMGPTAWPKNLAFCPDGNEPSQMRISIGGTVSTPGKFKPSPADPDFREVSPASGKVAYHLNYTEQGYFGIMLIQLLDDTHMKVEVFPDSNSPDLDFTAKALVYSR
jgi:hypothetical protein